MRSTFCKNIVFNLHSICIPVWFFRLTHFRTLVGFATTYATSAYHHWKCEFEPRSRRGVLDATLYAKVCQWLAVFFPNKTDRHDIPEILLTLNTINQSRIYLNVTNVVYQFKKSLKLRKGNTKLSIEVGQTIQCLIKKKQMKTQTMVNQTLHRKIQILETRIFIKTEAINGRTKGYVGPVHTSPTIERNRHHIDIMFLDTSKDK
jgi:hypothetical protein